VKYSVIYKQETISMKIKLPIILSAMIVAFAGSVIASEAAAPEASKTEAAPAAQAPKEGEKAPAAKKAKHSKHHGAKHHGKHHRHHKGHGHGHQADNFDQPWDYIQKGGNSDSGCSGDTSTDQGKVLPPEVPGQKGPNVPLGE
jgi:hypothetical protein